MNLPAIPSSIVSFFKQSSTIHGIGALVGTGMALGLHQISVPAAESLFGMSLTWILMQQEPDLSKMPAIVAAEIQALQTPAVLAQTALRLAPAVVQAVEPGAGGTIAHRAIDLAQMAMTQVSAQSQVMAQQAQQLLAAAPPPAADPPEDQPDAEGAPPPPKPDDGQKPTPAAAFGVSRT